MTDRTWFENSDIETLLRSLKAVAGILSEEERDGAREKMRVLIELLYEKQNKFPEHRTLIQREIIAARKIAGASQSQD